MRAHAAGARSPGAGRRRFAAVVLLLLGAPVLADSVRVVGSFRDPAHAAQRSAVLHEAGVAEVRVVAVRLGGVRTERVLARGASDEVLRARLAAAGLTSWIAPAGSWPVDPPPDGPVTASHATSVDATSQPVVRARTGTPAGGTPAGTRVESPTPVLQSGSDGTTEARRMPPPTLSGSPASLASGNRTEAHLDLGFQLRAFPHRGALGQHRTQPSVSLRGEFFTEWNDGRDRLTLTPFARLDGMDQRRTHADLREAYYSHFGDDWELHLGARRVFWGKTESRHLVDVINQTDLVEDIDEEDRLGQPMVQLVLQRPIGTVELFVLPGVRERTFPSKDGRLAGPVVIDGDARITSHQGVLDVGWAARWSGYVGDLEFGLAHFSGTAREPEFEIRGPIVPGQPIRLRPVYQQVSRSSLDAQYIVGDLALKLEVLDRIGQGPRSWSYVAGVERTFVGAFGGRADLGLLAEYLYDSRGGAAPLLAFEHDLFVGARLALNDPAGTQALFGLIRDRRTHERILSLEASRRLGDRWKLALEARVFAGTDPTAPGDAAALLDPNGKWGALADDDYLQLELTRYF